jgi:hypothetical protein
MTKLGERYVVSRTEDNEPVSDAFVLRVRKDPVAWLACWEYAKLTNNPELGEALRSWLLTNTPSEETLGSEGRVNHHALSAVQDITRASVS